MSDRWRAVWLDENRGRPGLSLVVGDDDRIVWCPLLGLGWKPAPFIPGHWYMWVDAYGWRPVNDKEWP